MMMFDFVVDVLLASELEEEEKDEGTKGGAEDKVWVGEGNGGQCSIIL